MKSKNRFTLFGRVCWKSELKDTLSGKKLIIINIGVKVGDDKFKNLFVLFFNNDKTSCADLVNDNINVNDFVRVVGYISSYKTQDVQIKTHIQLIGKFCIKCKYNPDIKSWEEIETLFNELTDMGEVASL